MEKVKPSFWVLCFLTMAIACHFYAISAFRFEAADGSMVMFNMMDGHPFRFYINYRLLNVVTQSASFLTPALLKMGLSFSALYYLLGSTVVLFPFSLLLLNLGLLWNRRRDLVPLLLTSYAIAYLPASYLHVSLVPESVGFGWIALTIFLFPPTMISELPLLLLGLFAVFAYTIGYETIFCLTGLFMVIAAHRIVKKEFFKVPVLAWGTRILMIVTSLIVIYLRLPYLEHPGNFQQSLKFLLSEQPLGLWFSILGTAVVVSLSFMKGKSGPGSFVFLFLFSLAFIERSFVSVGGSNAGYSLRVTSVFFAFIFFLLFTWGVLRERYLPGRLFPVVTLLMFISTVMDFNMTRAWVPLRADFEKTIQNVGQGCHVTEGRDWDIAERSIIVQQTYHPKVIVFHKDDPVSDFYKNDDPCRPVLNPSGSYVPLHFLNHKISIFDLDLRTPGK